MIEKNILIEVPVLMIGFNRPDIIRQTLAKVRESKPRNMYFAVDAARADKEGEDKLVREVKEIVKNPGWDCQAHFRFNEVNKGCEVTVSSAISWVLEDNDYVIVLEDDIVAPYSFLKFAQDMLVRYKDVENIYMISSDNYTPMNFPNEEDYTFSEYGHIWGWATWKRAWKHFDLYVNDFDDVLLSLKLPDNSVFDKSGLRRLAKMLKRNGKGNSTWDYVWSYIKKRDCALSIVPRVNLSSNIGVYGLHAKGETKSHNLYYSEDFEATHHPTEIRVNMQYDIFHFNTYLKQPSLLKRLLIFILRRIKMLFK